MNKYVLILTLVLFAVISCRPRYYGDRPRPPRPHRNDTNGTDPEPRPRQPRPHRNDTNGTEPEPRPRPPRPPRPHRNDTNRIFNFENVDEENNPFSFFKNKKLPKILGFPQDIDVPNLQLPKFLPRNNTNKPFPFPPRPHRKSYIS